MNRRVTRESEMIKSARCRLGLSQQQVATLIGIQIRHYQRFEYGERDIQEINIRVGLSLCALLELDPVDLVFNGNRKALVELKALRHQSQRKIVSRMQLSTEAREK